MCLPALRPRRPGRGAQAASRVFFTLTERAWPVALLAGIALSRPGSADFEVALAALPLAGRFERAAQVALPP